MANSDVYKYSDPSDNCIERQRDEVNVLQSMFEDDFVDCRTDISNQVEPATFEIKLGPRRGASGRQVHAKVVLFIKYKPDYPRSAPIINVRNDKGLSSEQINTLKENLQKKAKEFIGEEVVLHLIYYIQEYLEDYNVEKPSSFYEEMLKNQQKQEAAKATSDKKKKDIVLMQEKKKNKKIEDEAKRRHQAIRRKQKEDQWSDEGDIGSSTESPFGSPFNAERIENIPDIKVENASSDVSDESSSNSSDLVLHFLKGSETSRIARDFTFLANLGKGAFGSVIKVKNNLDDRSYAIKIIDSKNNCKLMKNIATITSEVKFLSRLNHENIVRYYNSWIEEEYFDYDDDDSKLQQDSIEAEESSSSDEIVFEDIYDDDDDGAKDEWNDDDEDDDLEVDGNVQEKPVVKRRYLCIQMEYCERSTLKTCIENDLYKDVNRVWRLFRELLDALSHIHEQGIIHRDLKPGNIFLNSDDHIKIGDFGLATIRKPKQLQIAFNLSDAETFQKDSYMSNLTTDVGTSFYMSPEMTLSSGHYDQQIDMYSLGIIFFEMCYTRMETGMERHIVLTNLRKEEIIFPESFLIELENQKIIIQKLLNHDPDCRPTSKKLLQSCLLPPVEIEEAKINEALSSAISNSQSKTYKYIVESFFNQKYDDVCDIMYDDNVFKPCNVKHSLLQQNITDIMRRIFCQHGAIRISTPMLMPRNKIHSTTNPTFMDQTGQLVCLPNNLKVPLIRYVKRRNIHNLKRYNIDRIFIGKTNGLHPKEIVECSFDIITPTNNNLLPDSEIIYLIEEIINEFNELKARNFSIVLNHTCILKALLIYCGVSASKHEEILHLVEKQGEKTKRIQEEMENLKVSEQKTGTFIKMLKQEGELEDVKKSLNFLTKCKREVNMNLKQGFRELSEILSYCQTLEIKLPIKIKLGFLRHVNQYSGMFFEVQSLSKKRTHDILATGGRYDKLMSDYAVPLYSRQNTDNTPCAVGISVSLDLIVTILNKEQDEAVKRCEFMVCAYPDKSSSKSVLKQAQSIWNKKKSATILYEPVQSLDKIIKQCTNEGISRVTVIKDQHHSREMVIEDTKWKKKNKADHTEPYLEVDTKSKSQVNSFKISFLIDKSTNKRSQESQILKVLNSNLKWSPINSSEVNVLVVDIPSVTVREIVARIDLTNEKMFQESTWGIYDNFSKRKYLQDLCEKIREIRFDKKSHNIILYTIKDNFFKII